MLRGVLQFVLTRRPLVLLGPAGVRRRRHVRLFQAQHRGLSQSGAGDPGDHRAIARPVGRGDGALLHHSDRGRACRDARRRGHPLDVVLRPVVRPRRVPLRRRLLFRADADRDQSAAERQPAEQRHAANPGHEPGRRDLSLSGGRTAAFRIDQSAHGAGLDAAAAPAHRTRRRAGQHLGRHHQGVSTSTSICTSSTPTT